MVLTWYFARRTCTSGKMCSKESKHLGGESAGSTDTMSSSLLENEEEMPENLREERARIVPFSATLKCRQLSQEFAESAEHILTEIKKLEKDFPVSYNMMLRLHLANMKTERHVCRAWLEIDKLGLEDLEFVREFFKKRNVVEWMSGAETQSAEDISIADKRLLKALREANFEKLAAEEETGEDIDGKTGDEISNENQ